MDLSQKSENMQFIRFIAAICVMYVHAFRLSAYSAGEFQTKIATYLGEYAVNIFFVFGGFLAARSLHTKKNKMGWMFIRRRLERIIPPLAFVVVFSVLMGSIFSSYSFIGYFSEKKTYLYLLNSFCIPIHDLPGVFEGNVNHTVNGSLWTLPVEMACFIAVYLLYRLGGLKKSYSIVIIIALPLAYYSMRYFPPVVNSAIILAILFFIGVLLFLWSEALVENIWMELILLSALVLCFIFDKKYLGAFFALPYFVIEVSFRKKQCDKKLGSLGKYSYCMYLWGFPIQQVLINCFGSSMNPYLNFGIAVPVDLLFAVITYNLIEKPLAERLRR